MLSPDDKEWIKDQLEISRNEMLNELCRLLKIEKEYPVDYLNRKLEAFIKNELE